MADKKLKDAALIFKLWNIDQMKDTAPKDYPWVDASKLGWKVIEDIRKLAQLCRDLSLAKHIIAFAVERRVENRAPLKDGKPVTTTNLMHNDILVAIAVVKVLRGPIEEVVQDGEEDEEMFWNL